MEVNLYAKDVNGNVLIWNCHIIDKVTSCTLAISHGRFGGQMQLEWERDIVPLNVGKSNETTAFQQAESRLKSRVTKKKRAGYRELNEEEALKFDKLLDYVQKSLYLKSIVSEERRDLEGNRKPMKAAQYYRSAYDSYRDEQGKKKYRDYWTDPTGKRWSDRKYYYILNPNVPKEADAVVAKFPMMLQPKINGIRSSLYLDKGGNATLKSKEGLIYSAPSHITDYVNLNIDMFVEDELIFDGELYIEGESLQVIQSAVKSYDLNTPRVKFIAFDLAIDNNSNIVRWSQLKAIFNKYCISLDCPLELITTYLTTSDANVQEMTDKFISQGYEGSILRDREAKYGFGTRRNNMLKLKRCIDYDFDIIRIEPMDKRPDLGLFVCKHKDNEFRITPTFNESDKAKLLISPYDYIGKKLQTKFYEWTDDQKPLHIIDTIIRDYE